MTQKVLKVGPSAAVIIPKKSLKELGIRIGDEVRVEVDSKQKRVVIESARGVNKEVLNWTDSFIKKYRPALEALEKK